MRKLSVTINDPAVDLFTGLFSDWIAVVDDEMTI
jgi:hypothetical protein